MNPKILLVFVFAVIIVVCEVSGRACSGGCVGCGFGPGMDYCSCNPSPYVVRPTQVKSTKPKCMKPVGDVCCTTNFEVKPVVVPRPKCVYKPKKRPVCYDSSPLIPAPDHLHDFSQDADTFESSYLDKTSCGLRPLYPVDAVSISLVNRLQDSLAASLPEEKLQYGFYTIPKDMPVFKHIPNVPEERLFTVDRQIVELKSPKQIVKCNTGCDEEIVLEDKEMQPIAYLSYSDLGYVPEGAISPKFITSCKRKGCAPQQPEGCFVDSEEIDYKLKPVCAKRVKTCGCCQ